jgi:hypothetical protein
VYPSFTPTPHHLSSSEIDVRSQAGVFQSALLLKFSHGRKQCAPVFKLVDSLGNLLLSGEFHRQCNADKSTNGHSVDVGKFLREYI